MGNQFFFCVVFVTSKIYARMYTRGITYYYTTRIFYVYSINANCDRCCGYRVRVLLQKIAKRAKRALQYVTGYHRLAAPDIPVKLGRYMPTVHLLFEQN